MYLLASVNMHRVRPSAGRYRILLTNTCCCASCGQYVRLTTSSSTTMAYSRGQQRVSVVLSLTDREFLGVFSLERARWCSDFVRPASAALGLPIVAANNIRAYRARRELVLDWYIALEKAVRCVPCS
jgi:hypothetical protein